MRSSITDSTFLNLKILSYAEENLANTAPVGRGFVTINSLREEGNSIGISNDAIELSLEKMGRYGLVIFDNRSRSGLDGASYFKISDCGSYYLHVLTKRFSYLDLMWIDTPIFDYDLVVYLRKIMEEKRVEIRFERTKKFIEYLNYVEERESQLYPNYNDSKLGKHKYVKEMLKSFNNQKNYIQRKLRNKYDDSR